MSNAAPIARDVQALEPAGGAGTVSASDAGMAFVTDDVEAAMRYIERHAIDAFGLRRHRIAPSSPLGEPRAIQPAAPR